MELFDKRERLLPTGWYPETAEQTLSMLKRWEDETEETERRRAAAVVPHAGWFFSGKTAFSALYGLNRDAGTVIIFGGHLSAGSIPVIYNFREFETPLGSIPLNTGLFEKITEAAEFLPGTGPDNTVEIQLPMVKFLFPGADIIALRVGSGTEAAEIGRLVFDAAGDLGISAVAAGSTDLTHYGPDYYFTPRGTGRDAVEWVKNVNDRRIIDAMTAMDVGKVLRAGNEDKAACSAGAAAAAITFAALSGVKAGTLVSYMTSYDVYAGDSFVGYAGIVY